MGERRLVDADVFACADLLELPVSARYLWVGMVCCCNREGRIRSDPRWLRNRILPQTRVKLSEIQNWLRYFESADMIRTVSEGQQMRSSSTSDAQQMRSSSTSDAQQMRSRCAADRRQTRTNAVASYYQLTNFSRYQRFRNRGHHITETSCDGDISSAPPPPRSPEDGAEEIPEEVRRFLDEVLLLPDGNRPPALQRIREIGHTAEDLPAWREALAAARREPGIRDPATYIRSRYLRARTPEAAGLRPANGTGDAPPPLSPAEQRKRDLISKLKAAADRIQEVLPGCSADEIGIHQRDGTIRLWQDHRSIELAGLADRLELLEEPDVATETPGGTGRPGNLEA